MSAEPAHAGPPGTPGRVILFRKPAPTRRRHDQGGPPVRPAAEPKPPATDHHRLANRIEQAYLRHRRTLTDPDTAQDYRIAVGMFADLLQGAHATGLIDETAHRELHAMIDSMRNAPDLVDNV